MFYLWSKCVYYYSQMNINSFFSGELLNKRKSTRIILVIQALGLSRREEEYGGNLWSFPEDEKVCTWFIQLATFSHGSWDIDLSTTNLCVYRCDAKREVQIWQIRELVDDTRALPSGEPVPGSSPSIRKRCTVLCLCIFLIEFSSVQFYLVITYRILPCLKLGSINVK